jgi:Protein of unknown function (DUF3375)
VDFDELESLRRNSPAWKLLRADNASFILGFLRKVFVDENVRSISSTELIGRLDDELYALHERLGEDAFPKTAKAYLDDWAGAENGWLRKYYPAGSDEVHFDATAAVEKALTLVESLRERSFVGTESRLNTVFELLRQMVFGAETDPDVRLGELRRRRDEIDAEITRAERGEIAVLDESAQRDRYQQFAATARELLADFREVEANFRALDRALRARIASWDGAKGALLDEVLGNRATIADSDQRNTFQAFYDFARTFLAITSLSGMRKPAHRGQSRFATGARSRPSLGCSPMPGLARQSPWRRSSVLAECDAHDRVASEIASLKHQRDALRFYCADRKAQLLTDQVGMLIGEIESYQDKLVVTKDRLRDLRIRKEQLALRRVGLGGNRLAEIDRLVDEASHERDRRQHRFTRFHQLLDLAGLEPVEDAAQFAVRRAQIARETDVHDERQADLQNQLTEVGVQVSGLEAESKGVNAELLSLKQRCNNIPKVHLDVRERLCGELHIDTGQLPSAGELIQVRPEWRSWEGAAERVLHGFALSMLVSGEHYTAVSDWINDHHLDARLVYFRVPERPSRQGSDGMITDRSLFTKLEIRDSPFYGWLEREPMHRADYECVDTMDDFRRAAKAVTRAGQIKGVRGRHEKNDVRRIDDRRYYVLGWDNEAKIDALLAQANWLQRQRNDL